MTWVLLVLAGISGLIIGGVAGWYLALYLVILKQRAK